MQTLIAAIEAYIPKCEQEEQDRRQMLDFLQRNPDALSRDNLTQSCLQNRIFLSSFCRIRSSRKASKL